MSECCQVRCLSHAANHVSHNQAQSVTGPRNVLGGELVSILVYLQKSFVNYQVSGGEVKGAILAELSSPVLTPWAVGWVQVERLGKFSSYMEIRVTVHICGPGA